MRLERSLHTKQEMNTEDVINRRAFAVLKSPRAGNIVVRPGRVVEHIPYGRDKDKNVTIEQVGIRLDKALWGRKFVRICVSEARIIPKRIPAYWRRVLRRNESVKGIERVGVCMMPYTSPGSTTLFNTVTGQTLESRYTKEEASSVKLWNGAEAASESKPSTTQHRMRYFVGSVEIEIEEVESYT